AQHVSKIVVGIVTIRHLVIIIPVSGEQKNIRQILMGCHAVIFVLNHQENHVIILGIIIKRFIVLKFRKGRT
ncbi:MAG: hypothetical protein KGL58_05850, partial [Pseudomonadota bacterium]|nr:hypothetical protein [Pseudomonadota bacterium]